MITAMDATRRCPCGSGEVYGECCGPRHDGTAPAPTAEDLMRARFSAFAVGDAAYLRSSWHPSTRPRGVEPDTTVRWTRLEIVERIGGREGDETGIVEFRAHHIRDGRSEVLHERSTFLRAGGAWVYLTGRPGD
jgi:SEC-C motif-containing protein